MVFKEGKIVDKFSVKGKDGKKHEVVFRYPEKTDVKLALKMVNGIRTEAEYLGNRRMETLKSEKKWLVNRLKEMKKRKALTLFVEVDKELIGDSSIWPFRADASSHVAEFGIMLKEEFTDLGIGTKLSKKLIQLAKKETGYKIFESGHFAGNKRSAKFHKKLGFKKYGKFPNSLRLKNGKYSDQILLYKVIK